MKLIVPVKMVPNPTLPVRLSRNSMPQPDIESIPLVINPFDEIALEEAVLLRENKIAEQVIVVSVGPASWEAEMQTALALGADRAVRIKTETPLSPISIARCIVEFTVREEAQLILCGRQGVDQDRGMVGPMTAALLGWGQATFVSKLQIKNGLASVIREIDGGIEELTIPLPAVITTDLRLNTPRYASLPNIMKARRKPLHRSSIEELGVEVEPEAEVVKYSEPSPRPPVTRLENIAELADILRAKGFLS
jgi:electron transfer flavoprotein beta subunit